MVAGLEGLEAGNAGLDVFSRVYLKRIGQLEECANVFAFLLNDEANSILCILLTVTQGTDAGAVLKISSNRNNSIYLVPRD